MADDDFDDNDFNQADAGSSNCRPLAVNDVRKGGFIAMKGFIILNEEICFY
jgi:hypothetical protein